jgi:hypothetical protein
MSSIEVEQGEYTYFLIDIDQGVVVGVWKSGNPFHTPDYVKKAAELARETGRRYSISKSMIQIEPPHPR